MTMQRNASEESSSCNTLRTLFVTKKEERFKKAEQQ